MALFAQHERIRRARILLEKRGVSTPEFVSQPISESWSRCLEMGLDPLGTPKKNKLNKDSLTNLLEKNHSLRSLALYEMQSLHRQIAGSNFVILFADKNGVILDSILDISWLPEDIVEFNSGKIWDEAVRGTNALGVALATGKPSVVHAGEHFFRGYSELTCAAVPICGPDGKLVAVLDAASDCQSRQHHTLALIKMSCLTIENGLFRNRYREDLVLELHNRSEFIGTLHAGMMAFDGDGRLLSCNRAARYLLQGIPVAPGTPFGRIFQTNLQGFKDQLRSSTQVFLSDQTGSTFAVKASGVPETRFWMPAGNCLDVVADGRSATTEYVYSDDALKNALTMIRRAVRVRASILIQGETGTGKEALARFAHDASGRKGAFVPVNCAALPEALIESEFFGYRGGSFTGARQKGAAGLVQQADKGTLFLDEVGELPLQLQAKLLRFLDDWKVRPVGAVEDQDLDIQLVSATNRDLMAAVQNGTFRADLYYRINAASIDVPPLRDRSDIEEIITFLFTRFENPPALSMQALYILSQHQWSGNIRELKNVITRLLISCHGDEISAEEVQMLIGANASGQGGCHAGRSLADHERNLVHRTYQKHRGNISAVARELNISRNKVYKKLEEIKISRG